MKVQTNRQKKVSKEILSILSKAIFVDKIHEFIVGNVAVNITHVEVSIDLKHANIYIMCRENTSEINANETVDKLNDNAYIFNKIVAQEIKTKYTPKIRFSIDNQLKEDEKLDAVLKNNIYPSDDELT